MKKIIYIDECNAENCSFCLDDDVNDGIECYHLDWESFKFCRSDDFKGSFPEFCPLSDAPDKD